MWWIVTKLRDITEIGESHQICGKHIIVDNSGTTHRRNIKYFERQDDFFYIVTFLTLQRTFWRHDMFMTSWRTCWRHDVFLISWRTFWSYDTLFDACRVFNFTTNFLTSWRIFEFMTNILHDDVFLTNLLK